MANAAALINEGLWRKDRDFQRLPRLVQCTFLQVLSQKDLDTAGVLTLHLELLAKGCDELTVEQLQADFAVLEERRFVFVDYDTDELFIRSYVRVVSVKSPNAWLSVPKNARLIGSEKIRRELAAELRRVQRKDASDLAREIDPDPTPSQPGPDPISTPSQPDTPSGPHSDPPSQVLVQVPVSPSVVGSVGVQRARPTCSKHSEDGDENCRACMRRRMWDETHESQLEADELERKRVAKTARDECTLCDDAGWVIGTEPAVKCKAHGQDVAHA